MKMFADDNSSLVNDSFSCTRKVNNELRRIAEWAHDNNFNEPSLINWICPV